MIKIDSFIKCGNDFLNINSFSGAVVDADYIEGGLEISVDGKDIMTLSMWDYVDQLWAYLLEGIGKLEKSENFETYFPDQPLELKFESLNSHMAKISVGDNSAVTNKAELIDAITRSAAFFYSKLSEIVPENALEYKKILETKNYTQNSN